MLRRKNLENKRVRKIYMITKREKRERGSETDGKKQIERIEFLSKEYTV